jgi:hypothetical protein
MKANELRIGNYYNQFGNIHQVNGHIISELEKAPQGQLWCKPIPLTEEWLIKFGFEKSQEQWYTIKYFTDCELATEQMAITYNLSSNRCAVFDAIEETDIVNILSYPIYTSKKVLYVHQLQNLYFAVTNEELTMK